LQTQRLIARQQFRYPPVVVGRDFDDPQLVFGDGGAKLSGQAGTSAAEGIRQEVADLGDRQRRNHEPGPGRPEELHAARMISVCPVESGNERSRVAQDHADAAPLESSCRSGYAKYLSWFLPRSGGPFSAPISAVKCCGRGATFSRSSPASPVCTLSVMT